MFLDKGSFSGDDFCSVMEWRYNVVTLQRHTPFIFTNNDAKTLYCLNVVTL